MELQVELSLGFGLQCGVARKELDLPLAVHSARTWSKGDQAFICTLFLEMEVPPSFSPGLLFSVSTHHAGLPLRAQGWGMSRWRRDFSLKFHGSPRKLSIPDGHSCSNLSQAGHVGCRAARVKRARTQVLTPILRTNPYGLRQPLKLTY